MKAHNGKIFVEKEKHDIAELIEIVSILRDPEEGCTWDAGQTHESLKN